MENNKKQFVLRKALTYAVITAVLVGGMFYVQMREGGMMNQPIAQNTTQRPVELVPTYSQSSPIVIPTTDSSMNIFLSRTDSVKGKYMTDFEGMTVYTFDNDTAEESKCSGSCEKMWPPYIADSSAQSPYPPNISLFKRKDGSMQYAWKGMPLYRYISDKRVGEINGDGIGGIWHIVKM